MIAAWASITTGWVLTHPVTIIVFGVLAGLLAICTGIYLLATSESGRHHASRPAADPPRRAGKARAWLRAAPRAVRSLPGAITRAWSTPVRAKTLGPGAGYLSPVTTATCPRASASSPKVDSPAPELHHEPGLGREDRATLAWVRALRGPGWTVLALRRQLAVLSALIASGRVTPGLHTAGSPGSEPGHPAGTIQAPTGGDAQGRAVRVCARDAEGASVTPGPESRPAARADLTGSLSPRPPQKGFRLASAPPPGAAPPDETDWTLLADLAPALAAERLDAQTQAQAGA